MAGIAVAAPAVAGAPKLQAGAAAGAQAAAAAATPVRPATRRKPRRLSGDAVMAPSCSDSAGDAGVVGTDGSTGTGTPAAEADTSLADGLGNGLGCRVPCEVTNGPKAWGPESPVYVRGW